MIFPIPFRGKIRIKSPWVAHSGVRKCSLFGYRTSLDLSNHVDRTIYLGCYEPLNTWRFRKLLAPGMTVIDVGANIGYFTLLAARCVGPWGRVIAIEPHPVNHALLSATVAENQLAQVTTLQIGLAERTGVGQISMADQAKFPNRTATMVYEQEPSAVPVPVRCLDDCVKEWEIKSIDLLKIDVDGFETRIIAGAQETLRRGIVRNLVIEFNDHWLHETGSSPERLRGMIEQTGLVDRTGRWKVAARLMGASEDRHFERAAGS